MPCCSSGGGVNFGQGVWGGGAEACVVVVLVSGFGKGGLGVCFATHPDELRGSFRGSISSIVFVMLVTDTQVSSSWDLDLEINVPASIVQQVGKLEKFYNLIWASKKSAFHCFFFFSVMDKCK